MRYCRFETEFGPRYGEVCERGGHDWMLAQADFRRLLEHCGISVPAA